MSVLDNVISLFKINKEIIDGIESMKGNDVVTKIWNKLLYTRDNEQLFSLVVQTETTPGQ